MNALRSVRALVLILLALSLTLPGIHSPVSGEEASQGLAYQYDLSWPEVSLTSSERLYEIQGLDLDGRSGMPSLPLKTLMLAVPPGFELDGVTVSYSAPVELEIFDQYPCNGADLSLSGDQAIAQAYEPRSWELSGIYQLEGITVACLNLYPLQWHEDGGEVMAVDHYTVELNLKPAQSSQIGDLERVRVLVDNPEVLPTETVNAPSDVLETGAYDYLIITSAALSSTFDNLADWKENRNSMGSIYADIRAKVVTLEEIRANSALWGVPSSHGGTGNDTQTLVRNFIIAAHQEWGVDYVLIGGDNEIIPSRILRVPDQISNYVLYNEVLGDIYYSGLSGNWDLDGDGTYGEYLGFGNDEADMLAEVYVGRAPVSNVVEAGNFVNKTIQYERAYVEQYSYDILLVGEKLDDVPTYGDDYKDEVFNEVLADEGLTKVTLYERNDTFSTANVLREMEAGVHLINHMGHGNPYYMVGIDQVEAASLDNALPFIVYSQACHGAAFDSGPEYPNDCVAEELVTGDGGAVAVIGNSRFGWYSPGSTDGASQQFDLSFFSQVFDDDVTSLGKALSQSKQEHVGESTSGSMRWVYMELNLLGDPETRVLMPERGEHDLAVVEVDAERAVMGEEGQISVRVQNLGKSNELGTVSISVDGLEIGEISVDLIPGGSEWTTVNWTPGEHRPYTISADVTCAVDEDQSNDYQDLVVAVDRRVSSDETWSSDVALTGGLIIESGATLSVQECNVTFQFPSVPYLITVNGRLTAVNASFQGGDMRIESSCGEVEFAGCVVSLPTGVGGGVVESGRLNLSYTIFIGGQGWNVNGSEVAVVDCEFQDQSGAWLFSSSNLNISGLIVQGGTGTDLVSSHGMIDDSSWTGTEMGLSIDRCGSLSLRDLALEGNGRDVGIEGDGIQHFQHDVENVTLSHGNLTLIRGATGGILEGLNGSLYLVECENVLVKGSYLRGSQHALGLIGCSGIEVCGNSLEGSDVGLLSIDSSALVWSNDLLENEEQVSSTASDLTFNKDYPAGGNHWSDLEAQDLMGGEEQDLLGPDGIADRPYLTVAAFDRYPKVANCSFVNDVPEAEFSISDPFSDRLSQIVFAYTGRSGSGIANLTWDLGDGASAFGERVTHTYGQLGSFQVKLTVTDHKGAVDDVSHQVLISNLLPTPRFEYSPGQPLPGETVGFQDLSEDADGTIVSWHWDFDDGSYSSEPSPSHAFMSIQDYLVVLTVTDQDGGSSARSVKVPVGNIAPTAGFTWSGGTITSLQDVIFTSISTDPDGQVASWQWDFGDGDEGSGATVKHRFPTSGNYLVTLRVTDDDGASNATAATITVINSRPVAIIECQDTVLSMVEMEFSERSFDPDGTLRSWQWDFGDGDTSFARTASHAYERPGEYVVSLMVIDDQGAVGLTVTTVTVLNRLPEISLTVPEGAHWSLEELTFSANATDLDGTIASYRWRMGDGTELAGAAVTHSYLTPGNYTINLTCCDDAGGESSVTAWIQIHNLSPRATVRTEMGDHPLELVFTALPEDDDGLVTGIDWSFGDGTFGQGTSVRHTYVSSGDYQVELMVTDDSEGAALVVIMVSPHTPNISLTDASVTHDEMGWAFSANITSDSEYAVNVNLSLEAGGLSYFRQCTVDDDGLQVMVPLENFTGGKVSAVLEIEEGWDADDTDNSWTGSVDQEGDFPYGIAAAITIAVIGTAAVLIIRRRK